MPEFGGGKPTIERRDVGASERGVMIGFWISKQDFRVSIPGTCRSICWLSDLLGRLGCFELEILNTRTLLSSDDLLICGRDGVRIVVCLGLVFSERSQAKAFIMQWPWLYRFKFL